MSIADEKYVSFTTYTRDGTPKSVPVWVVGLDDGQLGFTTQSVSWKVRRLNNDPRCTLQPSNSRGVPTQGSESVSGTGEFVQDERYAHIERLVKQKYRVSWGLIQALYRIQKLFGKDNITDGAIVVTLD